MVFLVSGGLFEGARPFPLKILDTKISVNSTSGECNKYKIIIQFIKGESLIKFLHKKHILVLSTITLL